MFYENRKSCFKGVFFTLIGFLMRKSCSFVFLFNCFPVQLFKCFPVPSYFRVPCFSALISRVKIRIFTLIELLMIMKFAPLLRQSFMQWL